MGSDPDEIAVARVIRRARRSLCATDPGRLHVAVAAAGERTGQGLDLLRGVEGKRCPLRLATPVGKLGGVLAAP